MKLVLFVSEKYCKNEKLVTKFLDAMKTIEFYGPTKNDVRASQNMMFYSGSVLINQHSFQTAKVRGINHFKSDVLNYFYHANKHFKT